MSNRNSLVFLILLLLSIFLISPYFEAKSYNKLTGGNVTYWDALFTELRVVGREQNLDYLE